MGHRKNVLPLPDKELNEKVPAPAADSSSQRGPDAPLTNPTDDLLDVNQHAEALAHYIRAQEKLPFTVGIFGQWGEGKTTMVNFLKYHLGKLKEAESKPLIFVPFSAWRFTTSEKLWRGLILTITNVLFGRDPETGKEKVAQPPQQNAAAMPAPESNNSMNKFAKFLVNDFFRPPLNDYEEFVQKLEDSDYGKITKRTPADQFDPETVASALVTGALSVAGTVAPLVNTLTDLPPFRSLTERRTQRQTTESASQEINALPTFRKDFHEMLQKQAGGEAVYVFIDDLDRAQPDVALDIMEAISIALSNVDCVFILAVDETLISQGLRLRYKELFAEAGKEPLQESLANKGEEYLEKIIQFRTRMPPRTTAQTKRLIAAEFADWTPAGDIIQTITGNNPRRIKQYCHRLSFQKDLPPSFTVESVEEERSDAATANT